MEPTVRCGTKPWPRADLQRRSSGRQERRPVLAGERTGLTSHLPLISRSALESRGLPAIGPMGLTSSRSPTARLALPCATSCSSLLAWCMGTIRAMARPRSVSSTISPAATRRNTAIGFSRSSLILTFTMSTLCGVALREGDLPMRAVPPTSRGSKFPGPRCFHSPDGSTPPGPVAVDLPCRWRERELSRDQADRLA